MTLTRNLVNDPCLTQTVPCVNGIPQEFIAQDAITVQTKADFPGTRVVQYRIGTAVPYAEVVHTAMVEHPEWFVRWTHPPTNNGSVCTVPPEAQTDRPGDNCSWPVRAGMYDFSQKLVQDWWNANIIAPAMKLADGVWIDGDGPDNGAYQCSGSCACFRDPRRRPYACTSFPTPHPPQTTRASCRRRTPRSTPTRRPSFARVRSRP